MIITLTWDLLLQYQTVIFKQQLLRQVISCLLGLLAIGLTYFIFRKQLKISKEQWEIIDKQMDMLNIQTSIIWDIKILLKNIDIKDDMVSKNTNIDRVI